jgi:hypothetical protein
MIYLEVVFNLGSRVDVSILMLWVVLLSLWSYKFNRHLKYLFVKNENTGDFNMREFMFEITQEHGLLMYLHIVLPVFFENNLYKIKYRNDVIYTLYGFYFLLFILIILSIIKFYQF